MPMPATAKKKQEYTEDKTEAWLTNKRVQSREAYAEDDLNTQIYPHWTCILIMEVERWSTATEFQECHGYVMSRSSGRGTVPA